MNNFWVSWKKKLENSFESPRISEKAKKLTLFFNVNSSKTIQRSHRTSVMSCFKKDNSNPIYKLSNICHILQQLFCPVQIYQHTSVFKIFFLTFPKDQKHFYRESPQFKTEKTTRTSLSTCQPVQRIYEYHQQFTTLIDVYWKTSSGSEKKIFFFFRRMKNIT